MPAGRPTILTADMIEDVRRLLPTVLYLADVSDYLGVERYVFWRWMHRGGKEIRRLRKPGTQPFPSEALCVELSYTVKKGLAEGTIGCVGRIKKASEEQWQAAAWLLERRFPGKWGLRDRRIMRELTEQVKAMQKALDAITQTTDKPFSARSAETPPHR